jgi:protocatechuate 3,4-dioxygenase beta subunit
VLLRADGYRRPVDDLTNPHDDRTTRRGCLARGGALLAGALGAGGWKAAGSEAATAAGGPAGIASGAVTCILAPEQTEGPYYIPNEKLRRNITEGRPGLPLALVATVVDASTCKPVTGAAVDIWHCDALGTYSGFGQGAGNRTFLRGIQKTDSSGVARFQTIYPGWYRGRTVHIHVKVHVAGNVVHTGQLYFSDAVTDAVYRRAPYSRRPARSVRNADDFVYRNGGKNSLLDLRKSTDGYVGRITLGVHRS